LTLNTKNSKMMIVSMTQCYLKLKRRQVILRAILKVISTNKFIN